MANPATKQRRSSKNEMIVVVEVHDVPTSGIVEGYTDTDSSRDFESEYDGQEAKQFKPKAGLVTGGIAEGYSDTDSSRGYETANEGQKAKRFRPKAGCSTAGIADGYSDTDSSRSFETANEGQETQSKSGSSSETYFDTETSGTWLVSGESLQSVANKSPHQVAENARKASIAARKAADSAWKARDSTREAVIVGRKRMAKGYRKAELDPNETLRSIYRVAANTFSDVVMAAERRIGDLEAVAAAAEAAADAAERAANDLTEMASEEFNDVQENMDLAVHATNDANRIAVVAVKNEYLALKIMLRCWAEFDDAEIPLYQGPSILGRRCSIPDFIYWECGKCRCKVCTVLCISFVTGCILILCVPAVTDSEGWLVASSTVGCVFLFLSITPAFIKLVVYLLRTKRHRRREKTRNVCRNINNRLADLDQYFIKNGIEFECLPHN